MKNKYSISAKSALSTTGSALLLAIYSLLTSPFSFSEDLRVINTFGDGVAIESVINKFRDSTSVPVSITYMRQDDFKTNLMLLLEKSGISDVVIIPADHLGLHELADYSVVSPTMFSSHIESKLWDTTVSDGAIRGVPINQGNHLVMYYNKSLISRPAKTWDELLDQKTRLDKSSILTIQWNHDDAFYFLPFLSAYNGWPLVNGEIQLNTPAMVEALTFYKILRDRNLYSKSCDYDCATDLFLSGKLAYNINGTWAGEKYARVLGDNLGVAALPSIDGLQMRPSFSTYVIAFPHNRLNGRKKDQIIKLVNFLLSHTTQTDLWNATAAIPAETTAFNHVLSNSSGYLNQTLRLLDSTKPLPADHAMTFLWDAIQKGLMRQNVGVMTPTQAAAYMQKLAERHARHSQLLDNNRSP